MLSRGIFRTSTVKDDGIALGQRVDFEDGRSFVYALMGAGAVTQGKVVCGAAPVANHQDCAVTDFSAVGFSETTKPFITVTLGDTAATANQYSGGYVAVIDGAGEGTLYKIASHPAALAQGSLKLTLDEPIRKALATASTKVALIPHRNAGCIVMGTTPEAAAVGVTVCDVAASAYFWAQVAGPCAVLGSGTLVQGNPVALIGAAGAVGPRAAVTDEVLGHVMSVSATTEYSIIDLCIA
jgi:hypothetical protein